MLHPAVNGPKGELQVAACEAFKFAGQRCRQRIGIGDHGTLQLRRLHAVPRWLCRRRRRHRVQIVMVKDSRVVGGICIGGGSSGWRGLSTATLPSSFCLCQMQRLRIVRLVVAGRQRLEAVACIEEVLVVGVETLSLADCVDKEINVSYKGGGGGARHGHSCKSSATVVVDKWWWCGLKSQARLGVQGSGYMSGRGFRNYRFAHGSCPQQIQEIFTRRLGAEGVEAYGKCRDRGSLSLWTLRGKASLWSQGAQERETGQQQHDAKNKRSGNQDEHEKKLLGILILWAIRSDSRQLFLYRCSVAVWLDRVG